jgi:hypothetical protein
MSITTLSRLYFKTSDAIDNFTKMLCKVDNSDRKIVWVFSRLKPGSYLKINARHAADGAVPPASGGEEVV